MNNFRPYGPRDEPSTPDGDSAFVGVEERIAPQLLPAGYLSEAKNARFRNGRAGTRDGITLLPWMKGDGLTPFAEVYGAAVFNDPNQSGQWILIAADGGVWKTRPNATATAVPMPAGITLTAATFKKFIQANSAIILLRGLDDEPLQCTALSEGFKTIPIRNQWAVTFDHATNRVGLAAHNLLNGDPVKFTGAGVPPQITAGQTYYVLETPNADAFTFAAAPGGNQVTWNTGAADTAVDDGTVEVLDGAANIPPANDGIFHLNRLFLINGKDTLAVSDIGDFTRYQPIQAVFRINEGDSHTLLSLAQFNEDTLIFFKSGSVLKALGISGDLTQAQGPLNVTPAYGAAGAQAVTTYGNDLYWLTSELRISSLRLTELNKEQGTNTALSDPLIRTFGRINAGCAGAARLAVYDGFLHVALPLDDANIVSTTNRAVSIIPGEEAEYATGAPFAVGVTPGKRYQYRQGEFGGSLVNGTETLQGDADFVAQETPVYLLPLDTLVGAYPVQDTVKEVLATGVNNAVAVYDFLNQAWAGSDEADGVTVVKDFVKFIFGGRERLGFIGADGWLHLYGDGMEDEKLLPLDAPYVDLLVERTNILYGGSTIQVNNSAVITTDPGSQSNTSTTWGTAGDPRANIWSDGGGSAGYNPLLPDAWINPGTSPHVTAQQIEWGVRFIGIAGFPAEQPNLPDVKINGTLVRNGEFAWARLDSHSGSEITPVPIETTLRLRAYLCQRTEAKRYTCMALQLATWSPKYTLSTLVQGIGTETVYAQDQTRDRLKYFSQFDTPDWDPTNANDDYAAPGREDYSWQATNAGILLGADGVDFDAHQEYVHRLPISERGLWLAPKIVNTQGRLELVLAGMEAQAGDVLGGIAVN